MNSFFQTICYSGNWTCADNLFQCNSGYPACITSARLCDGIQQCSDGSDEIACGNSDHVTLTCLYDHLFCLGTCGYEFSSTIPNGVITSPSYPNMYPKYAECIYSISQENGTYISLQIHIFNLLITERRKCSSGKYRDFIEIRDGNSNDSVLMGKFCGTDIPANIQSTSNNLWIR